VKGGTEKTPGKKGFRGDSTNDVSWRGGQKSQTREQVKRRANFRRESRGHIQDTGEKKPKGGVVRTRKKRQWQIPEKKRKGKEQYDRKRKNGKKYLKNKQGK